MATIKEKATEIGVKKVLEYIEKDPEKNIGKVIDWLEKVDTSHSIEIQLKTVKKIIQDDNNNWMILIKSLFTDIDEGVRKALFENFILNTMVLSQNKREVNKKKYDCNIPWAILLDPTSACNLKCVGCWASEYGHSLNLSLNEIDDIVQQGKNLGVYMYIYTGGEPTVRAKDLFEICQRHSDCVFLAFTNGIMIDDEFAKEMLKVKNFVPAISIEGDEVATDGRRGKGTYLKVLKAMETLKRYRLPFGVSCCYTSHNLDSISSEAFIDSLVNFGAKFAWFFHYMPVGNNAVVDLLPNAGQRALMYHRIRKYRKTKPIFTIDFQNDGEYVKGCIAAGRNYLHINPNGDIEPCVFIHYSDSNIREKSLLEALQSPFFQVYKKGQPFNPNHLQPCPMLENPHKLIEMVNSTGAHSTDLESKESVEHLCSKCKTYAKDWEIVATDLWNK